MTIHCLLSFNVKAGQSPQMLIVPVLATGRLRKVVAELNELQPVSNVIKRCSYPLRLLHYKRSPLHRINLISQSEIYPSYVTISPLIIIKL